MLESFPISPDGLRVEVWAKGEVKSVDDGVLKILIGEGVCEIVPENKALTTPEKKSRKRAG